MQSACCLFILHMYNHQVYGEIHFFLKKSSSFQLITNQKMEFLELYVLFSGSLLQSSFDRIFHVKIN